MAVIGTSAVFGASLVDKRVHDLLPPSAEYSLVSEHSLPDLPIKSESLTLLYIGYGVVGGIGNGFGYVTPIATLIRWFPDKRGLVTGLAVMGFGAGAFFMGQIAPKMVISMGIANTYFVWGVIFLILVQAQGSSIKILPRDGYRQVSSRARQKASQRQNLSLLIKLSRQDNGWMLWAMLFKCFCRNRISHPSFRPWPRIF